jgi:hypothetical protein
VGDSAKTPAKKPILSPERLIKCGPNAGSLLLLRLLILER